MGYMLSPAVSFAFVDGRAIFLDLSADRYFCLAPQQQDALKSLVAGDMIDANARSALDPLVKRGILIEVAHASSPIACSPAAMPSLSMLDGGLPRPGAGQIAAAAFRIKVTKFALRHTSFQRMIAGLARVKLNVSGHEIEPQKVSAIVAAFEKTNLFLSPHRQCLPRSLALAMRLAGLGANINLVIGVANNPFSAHCWVQHKHIVLNDRLEKVQGYMPVLVV